MDHKTTQIAGALAVLWAGAMAAAQNPPIPPGQVDRTNAGPPDQVQTSPIPPDQVNQTNASPTPVPPPVDVTVAAVAPPAAEIYRCEDLTRRLRQILDQALAASNAKDSQAASGHISHAIEVLAEQGPQTWQREAAADVP